LVDYVELIRINERSGRELGETSRPVKLFDLMMFYCTGRPYLTETLITKRKPQNIELWFHS